MGYKNPNRENIEQLDKLKESLEYTKNRLKLGLDEELKLIEQMKNAGVMDVIDELTSGDKLLKGYEASILKYGG